MANEMPVLNAGIHMKMAFTSAELNDTEEGLSEIVQSGKRDKNCYIELQIHFMFLQYFLCLNRCAYQLLQEIALPILRIVHLAFLFSRERNPLGT